jgi:hypothetical protein
VRTGADLFYYASEGPDKELTLIHQQPFGPEDIKQVRIVASTGGNKSVLDARVTDFRIRADSLPGVPETATPPPAGGRRWWVVALLVGLTVILAFALAVWLRVRRRPQPEMPDSAPDLPTPGQTEVVEPILSTSCPACEKNFKVRARLTGKKVKCPGCGRAVLVPAPGADESASTPEVSSAGLQRGRSRWFLWGLGLTALVLLVALGWIAVPLFRAPAPPEQQPAGDFFYQDFRANRPLHSSLQLVGPDLDAVIRPENEGLRITLPANRPVNRPVEVVATFPLSGDFEITGTYELLSASRPTRGYGVGVSLNIADSDSRNTFAKVARAQLVKEGSVFQSEFWTKEPNKDYQVRTQPTESRIGQLRLLRKGSALHCLAADGLGAEFHVLFSQEPFSTEDMTHVHFVVADSGNPGNAVDARLVDLKIRSAGLLPDRASDAAAPEEKGSKAWLMAGLLIGLVIVLACTLGVWLSTRQRRPE